jgi:hypothetical protein
MTYSLPKVLVERDCPMVWVHWLHHPHIVDVFPYRDPILCMGYGPIVPLKPKVSIRWETPPNTSPTYADHKMCVGRCAGCSHTTQYWSWGATYGHMLEHRWIGCEGDRRRGTARQAKFTRLRDDPERASEARLSCGGRTHAIMGDEGRDTVRRADLPADVPSVPEQPAQEGGGAKGIFTAEIEYLESLPFGNGMTLGEQLGHPGGLYG